MEDDYEWVWLYAAVEPLKGESFFLLLPWVNGDCLEIFLQEFRQATGEESIALVLDNAPSHLSQKVQWPKGIQPVPLPAYSPELNPAEQIFKFFRQKLSNRVFDSIEELEDALSQLKQSPAQLSQMTAYPWWKHSLINSAN